MRPSRLAFLLTVRSTIERRPDLFRIEHRHDPGSIELLLHRQEMPSLLLRQHEEGDVFAREAFDLLDGHDDGRAAVDDIDDGDRFEVTVFDKRGGDLCVAGAPGCDAFE
jgi:hypothetical protein